MILQRLALSLKRRDWGAVIIEVGIVVIGILIGLQVDDWNRGRQDRLLEREYAIRLVDDLDRLRAANALSMEATAAPISRLTRALDTIRGGPIDAANLNVLKEDLSSLDFYPGIDADSFVLAELISTGNIRVIRDPMLRAQINRLAAALDGQGTADASHFDLFLRLRGDTHRALELVPTQTEKERIDSAAEDLRGNPTLDYVVSFSIELYTVQQTDWHNTDRTVREVRNRIAAAYGIDAVL